MKRFLFFVFAIMITFSLMAKTPYELQDHRDENATHSISAGNTSRETWDLLLQFDVDTPTGQTGLAGMEWDGEFFYATKWSGSSELFKFDSEGNYIESITVPVTGARDLAYDGEYMYGSAAGSTVYCWVSDTGEAVPENNIEVTGQAVRAIAYDPLTDTFWSGNWGDPVVNWDRDGNVINTYAFGTDLYGLAFDSEDPDGPFIYAFQQSPGCLIDKIDPEDGTVLETYDATALGGTGAIAGGLCYMSDWDPALRTLGALLQGTPDYICVFELGENAPVGAPAGPDMFTVTPDAGGALSAELGWMNPDETVVGDPLTDLDEMRVYRDDELIHTINNPTIGGIENWTDNVPESGMYSYSVVGFNDEGEGIPASASVWIGEDVPGAITGLTVANVDANAELSWANPDEGLHGGPFNEAIEGYHIVRNDGEEFEPTGELTMWTDDTITEEGLYSYTITPYNSIGDGASVTSDPTWIGESQAAMFGDPNTTLTGHLVPANYYYKNSLTQTIYYAEDFASQGFGGGAITAIMYYNTFVTDLPGMPVNIWMMNTDLESMDAGFVNASEMTQVYSTTVDFPAGQNEIMIQLDEPFIYEGGNLLICYERVMDDVYYSSSDNFFVTETENAGCSAYIYSDSNDYDPYNPPDGPTVYNQIPNTMMFINTTGLGSMEGYAYNEDTNEPLEGVLIELMEQRLHTYTDANGHYNFPGLFEGSYEAHATLFAHAEDVETVVIVADETTEQDFYLQPVPQVEVTGRVVGSDYPDIGLANAEVTLSGMGVHEGVTDADGYFMINTVYASNTYEMVVVAEGYEVLVGEAIIGAANTDLGDVIVNEISFPAYQVIAVQNDEDDEVAVTWHGPNPNAGNLWDFEDDDGEFVSNDATGWQWGEDATVGANSGTNIWGTTLNAEYALDADYQLMTPEVSIPTDDAVLTFWHYYDTENYYDGGNVKISTDGGDTWAIIEPVGGYPEDAAYAQNAGIPNEPCFTGNSGGWVLATFEIGMYQGEQAMFKFHFGSDYIVTYPGWFIDDVYIGMPEEDLMTQTNRNFRPVANLLPQNNDLRIIEDYALYRLLLGEEELEENWDTIAEGLLDTTYTDMTWAGVESDIYKYAVKAVYTNNVYADPAFSNWVAKDYYTNASVTVMDFFDNAVEEAEAKFMCQTPDPDGMLYEYEMLTDVNGEAYFPMIWKGDYNIRITKENMATYEEEMVPIYEPYTLEVQLTENLNPVTGLDYSVIDDDVTLWWNEPADEAFFDLDSDDGEFISNDATGWAWGEDTTFGANTGTHAWVTALNGNYINSADWQLTTPEVPIPGDGQLSFYYNMDCENSWDGGNVKISVDAGTTWELITPDEGYPDDSIVGLGEPGFTDGPTGWVLTTFDLTMYEGESAMFMFHFGTDGSVNSYPGWAIDDVRVGAPLEVRPENRIFENFIIYRDGAVIADDVTELTYTDEDVADGTYTYGVTAMYTSGESEVEEIEIEVYPLNVTGYVTASDTPDTDPFEGVAVTIENDMFFWETMTDANGEFTIASINGNQTYTITCYYEGYQTWSEELVVTDQDVDYEMITLLEIINPPYGVLAEVNDEDTECDLIWNAPGTWPEYEIIYDDGEGENATAWYDEGNERAVWFTAQGGPCQVVAGSMNIYDGTWPAGQILTPFTVAVWAYDEATGLPGEMLTSTIVTPTDYFWVDFEFEEPAMIDGTEFFLGYIQGGAYPDCAGIAIDENDPIDNRSYENYVTGGGGWVISSYQDFMLRAVVAGPMGRQMTLSYDNPVADFGDITPHKGAISEHAVNLPRGLAEAGDAKYLAHHVREETNLFQASSSQNIRRDRELIGYNIIRGEFGDESNWPMWEVVEAMVEDTVYTDVEWVNLEDGTVYTYGVRSVYTNDNMSDPAFSNWVGKDMYATLDVTLTTNIGDIPVGAIVTLEATEPDPDGNYPEYEAITDDDGECSITGIWKGHYLIEAELTNFATLEDELDILEDTVTYTGMITEMMFPAFDVYVEENHSGNAWISWHSPSGALNSFYDFEDNNGEFTSDDGWEWANGSNSGEAWSGDNCWSCWPGAEYPNNADAGLYTPIIEVPSDETQLMFYHWYDIESYWDGGNVKISTDEGATWTLITPIEGYPGTAVGLNGEEAYNGDSGGWIMAAFDLSMYDGEDVMFKFHFGSDSSVTYMGWDIDDVYIGEPEERGRPVPLFTEKQVSPFSKAEQPETRLERLEGYSIFRGFADDVENFEDWDLVVEDIADTTYEDTTWPEIEEPGVYVYCVRVQYTGGVLSEPSFSNEIGFEMYVPVTINVTGDSGDPMDGATVLLACHDGAHTYESTVSGGMVYWEEVWKGVYDLDVTMTGYTPYSQTDIWITDTMVMPVELNEMTPPPSNLEADASTGIITWEEPSNNEYAVLLEEGFETWPPADWTFVDDDGDGFEWDDGGALGLDPYEGSGVAYSASYTNEAGALTPDNWLITPAIQMDYNGQINYFVCAQDAAWAGEHYGVYVSTTGTDPADFTLLFEETMVARSANKVERLTPKGSREQGTWYERCVPIEGYTGSIYLAFRHFNVTDMFYLDLDEVTVSQGAMPMRHLDYYNVYLDGGLVGQTTETNFNLSSMLTNGVEYTAGVSAHYSSGNESDPIEVTFTYGNNDTPETDIPAVTALTGNYPNPFNPETDIAYGIAEAGNVHIEIFNIKGQRIKTLVNEYKDAGTYSATWNGTNDFGQQVTSGVYFYKMKSGRYTSTKKMILMK